VLIVARYVVICDPAGGEIHACHRGAVLGRPQAP
jgi:hypothetical protein